LTDEEIAKVEIIVNRLIREDLSLQEQREVPMTEARKLGAMALFGEKYGDKVRVIRFGESIELCGGTHISSTGKIGLFRIVSESSIAAGIRRIEACTGIQAEAEARDQARILRELGSLLKSVTGITEGVKQILEENQQLRKKIEQYEREGLKQLKTDLKNRAELHKGISLICEQVSLSDPAQIKDLAYQLKSEIPNLYLVLGALNDGKPSLTVMISEELVSSAGLNAGLIVRESAKEMQGGGGGQPFFATAGGKDPDGLARAIAKARQALLEKLD